MNRARERSGRLPVAGWVACLAAVALIATAPAVVHGAQQEVRETVEEGVDLLQQEKPQEALEKFDEAIDEAPGVWQAHYFKGRALGLMGKNEEAREAFLRTIELNPTRADAYQFAAMSSFQAGDFETAWEMAIIAHQMGIDMSEGFKYLRQASDEPSGFQERLEAPRIYVSEQMDAEGLMGKTVNPFTGNVDLPDREARDGSRGGSDVTSRGPGQPTSGAETAQGGSTDPTMTSSSRATGAGQEVFSQTQADLAEMLRRTRGAVARSEHLALVPENQQARYVLLFEVDDITEDEPRKLEGYIKLVDSQSGEQVYRRVLELDDIGNAGDLNADLSRYIGYMVKWFEENQPG